MFNTEESKFDLFPGELVYLASPYSIGNKRANFYVAVEACARLFDAGVNVISPIVHCHPVASIHGLSGDFDFWKQYNYKLLSLCKGMYVLKYKDWTNSIGVQAEILYALNNGIKTIYVTLGELQNLAKSELQNLAKKGGDKDAECKGCISGE